MGDSFEGVQEVNCTLALIGNEDPLAIQEKWAHNPLMRSIRPLIGRVAELKERVRAFYFEVMLSPYQCPQCGGRLRMTGQSLASCSCGNNLDPTLSFQRSPCCGVALLKKTFHYACSRCHQIVPSRFLFDEQIFDAAYFREMMQESRNRAKQRKEEIRRLLADSRSGALQLTDDLCLDAITGLTQDLDLFIRGTGPDASCTGFETKSSFRMEDYRNHILTAATWSGVLFSEIEPLIDDDRQDRVWRFMTLVFMDNDREVNLSQDNEDIRIQRVNHEAHA